MICVFQIVGAVSLMVGLAFLEMYLHGQHAYVPLRACAMLASTIWAAWESSRIKLQSYKTPMSFAPLVVGIFCALLWIVAFPLFLYSRYRVLSKKAAYKGPQPVARQGAATRLTLFAMAALGLGATVLFCMFAPKTNPSFLEGMIFKPDFSGEFSERALRRASDHERVLIDKLKTGMQHRFVDDDFKQLGLTVPQQMSFDGADKSALHAYYFKTPGATNTVLFSWSGLGDQRLAAMLGYFKILQEAKLSIFAYDYRGFAASTGHSSLETSVKDGSAAYDYLVQQLQVDPQHIVFMGRDIGAYVSVQLSKMHPCKALILEEPWTSLKNLADELAPAMQMIPIAMYPDDGLDNMAVLTKAHPPLLLSGSSRSSDAFAIFKKVDAPKNFIHTVEFDAIRAPDFSLDADRYKTKIEDTIAGISPPPETAVEADNKAAAPIAWGDDLDKAMATSKQEKKLILIDVYTDWCGWCKRLDKDTYSDPAVQRYVNQHFVALKANAEKPGSGETIAKRYDITGFPAILAIDADGHVRGKISGYLPPTKFLQEIESFAY